MRTNRLFHRGTAVLILAAWMAWPAAVAAEEGNFRPGPPRVPGESVRLFNGRDLTEVDPDLRPLKG